MSKIERIARLLAEAGRAVAEAEADLNEVMSREDVNVIERLKARERYYAAMARACGLEVDLFEAIDEEETRG